MQSPLLMIFDLSNQPSESPPIRSAEATLQHCMRSGRTQTSTIISTSGIRRERRNTYGD
jgi:hypothetical protein